MCARIRIASTYVPALASMYPVLPGEEHPKLRILIAPRLLTDKRDEAHSTQRVLFECVLAGALDQKQILPAMVVTDRDDEAPTDCELSQQTRRRLWGSCGYRNALKGSCFWPSESSVATPGMDILVAPAPGIAYPPDQPGSDAARW